MYASWGSASAHVSAHEAACRLVGAGGVVCTQRRDRAERHQVDVTEAVKAHVSSDQRVNVEATNEALGKHAPDYHNLFLTIVVLGRVDRPVDRNMRIRKARRPPPPARPPAPPHRFQRASGPCSRGGAGGGCVWASASHRRAALHTTGPGTVVDAGFRPPPAESALCRGRRPSRRRRRRQPLCAHAPGRGLSLPCWRLLRGRWRETGLRFGLVHLAVTA